MTQRPELYLSTLPSPLGLLLLVTNGEHLCALDFEDYRPRMLKYLRLRYGSSPLHRQTQVSEVDRQVELSLQGYFAGNYHQILTIPVHLEGTAFQKLVWSALRQIPAGTTVTYGQLATQLGNPKASRAVGMANAHNPVAIAVPCHRVVGAGSKLTGYAGGLARKQWLLEHEGVLNEEETAQQTSLPLELR